MRWNRRKMSLPSRDHVGIASPRLDDAHPGKVAILERYGTLHVRDKIDYVTVQWVPSEDSQEEGFWPLTYHGGTFREAVDRLHRHVTAHWVRLAETARYRHRHGRDDEVH